VIYLEKGYIGCFKMSDKDSGKRQIEEYIKQLRNAGHKKIIAPINGDTWHTYRLVSWSSGMPVFPLEPQNPLWYNEVYEELGFTPLKKYRSDAFAINEVEPLPDINSVSFRSFREDDLRLIYDISIQGFDENFLYNDISFEKFNKLYQPFLPMIDPALVEITEVDGEAVGFMFSFAVGESMILKTMAVTSEFRSKGIGAKMINRVLLAGKQKGVKNVVAALIAEGNHSHNIVSNYNSQRIREYTLYCLEV